MAEESLRIRIDVNTATLRELTGEMKRIQTVMKDAAQSDIPGLNAQYQQLSSQVKGLTGRHGEFGASVKAARTEARTFRFALLELTHGLDGVANTFGVLTGAGDKAKEGIKVFTGGAKEALAAGLGLKFGIEAMGESMASFATPVALAVGGLTLLATGVAEFNKSFNESIETIEKNRLELLKLDEALAGVLKDLKVISEEQYIDKMSASIEELTKRAEESTKAVFSLNIMKSLLSGFAVMDVEQVKKTPIERQKEALAVAEAVKKQQDEIIKGSEAGAKAAQKEQDERDQATERDLANFDEREKLYKRFLEDEQHDFEVSQQLQEATRKENAEGFKRFLEDQQMDFAVEQGKAGTEVPLEDQLGNWMMGIDVLQSGFQALSASIHSGLASAFGQATSMFQQFVIGVLDGITSIAEKLASSAIIAGIFSLIPGLGGFGALFHGLTGMAGGGVLTEPVFGIGQNSGQAYAFAERAPEQISPLTSFGDSGGSYNRIEIVGSTRIAGRDLLQSWKETRIIDRKGGGNI